MKNLITVILFLGLSYLSFGQFNAVDLHSEVTKVQPMTGIVFWSENSNDLSQLGNKVQLEFSYLVYSDVIQNQGAYNWNIVDNLLANAASNGRQMIIRFRYTYPGVTTPSVPNYVRNSSGYQDQTLSVEGSSTYIPDWSSQALQDFTKEFYTAFAARYDNDPRLAFLQMGFGSYSEYHLYDGPLNLGQTFPSKSYQTEFLYHVNGLFQETQWGISIDAASSTYTSIGADGLQSLNYGLFDDSFLHETHSANDSEYNRASWLFFGANKYQTNAAGGELNYYSTYDQQNVLSPNGPWGTSFEQLSEQYNISYMIGNDQLSYQSANRIESAGMATGYRFSVESYETDGSTTRATVRNTGIAPIYYDAYPSIGGTRSNTSLKGLLPNQAQQFIIPRVSGGEDFEIQCDRLSSGQIIQFDANIDASSGCQIGTACDDGDVCTTGETYDANCNCTGGTYTCGGNDCITIDQSLNDWSNIASLSSGSGFTVKAADDNNTLYISVSGTIGDFGEGYQIFLDTDNSGSEFTYYSAWSQTGFDAMIENGSFSAYTGTGSDWTWSAETPIISSKTAAGIELKIDKSLLNASSSNIRIGFISLSNWGGAAFVPTGNNAANYTMSSALNCGDTCPDADNDGVCDADDACPNMNDALIGTPCNDNDVCTTGETYNSNCNCTGGTFQDADGDGVCDANDICAAGDDNVDTDGDGTPDACDDCNISQGTPCNDNDVCTTGETYDNNCNCTGGTFQDADGDGVCVGNDPNDNDPCIPNDCNGDECELLTNINFDNNLNNWATWGATAASVNGVANIANIITATQPWEVGFSQSNQNITLVQGETYTITFRARADANRPMHLHVGMKDSPYVDYHYETFNLTPTIQEFSRTFTMNSPTDFNVNFDFNLGGNTASTYIDAASLRKTNCGSSCPEQGQSCNDNDPCTTGETYDANCNCTGGTFQDADADGVCDADDACPNMNDALIGTACNDNDACTTGETYNATCNCTGGIYTDADGDGVCAANDPNDNDPCIPNACNGDDCELLTNINFDNNTNNWATWGATATSVNGVVNITNIITAANPWDVGFSQSQQNITLVQGETYEVTFRARADANREMYLYVGMLNSPYTAYHYQTVNLTSNMQEFTATFTMNSATDNNVNFDFNLGGNATNTYIDFASLRKANCGPACPEQGQSCNDNNPCTTGETYDANCNCNGGTFQDADQDGVCDANDACPGTNDALIGTACDDGDNCTTGETYNSNCNCTGGTSQDADNDGVCAALDPNDNDPCIPNSCGGDECELLTNINFDNNTNNWVEWGCNTSSVNGVANITGIIPGVNPWEVGFSQSQQNITLVQGETYEVSFRARADANREMYLYVGMLELPYTDYHYQTVNLTPNMQEFTATFTMNSATDNNVNFDFNLGGNATNTYIDFASLRKANCGGCPSAGTPCNDGDSNTTNDVEDGNCNCSGTPINPPTTDCDCPDLSTNGTVVSVSNITQLQNAINNSNGNTTIMVQPGDYVLNYGLSISADKPNLTIMGATGNRDDVTLRGLGWNNSAVTHIFDVSADGFTVANMTLRDVYYHLIQIHSENDADDFTAQNVRFLDGKEQLLKVSAGASTFSDRGRVLCCAFEFTAGIAYQNYTGGIDAHKSKDWLVQNNTFKGIRSPDDVVAEHAIHFWRDCEGTRAIGNQIERCDRGIGFGLGNVYENGHRGGLIMNNFVHTNRDVGIGLEYAPDIKVYNNTVITDNYPRSIEYRFPGTSNVQIINNLVSGEISDRSSGATGTLTTNYQVSNSNIFVDAANYDYHLAGTPSGIVDAGTALSEVTADIDCDNRNGGIDIGADEVAGGNAGNDCQQQGQTCNDGNNCTTGSTYDANCNCVGGNYTDADGDGLCIGEDPNDNDPCNPNACNGCDVFDEENFENGWGIWNDGGSDVRRNSRDAAYANSGNFCVRLRDDTGSASSISTDALNMNTVTSVDISFSYIPVSMENNEDFFLEFSNDGVAYAVVGRWIRGRDFENDIRYNETITIDGPFGSNTRFRFRCDASGNGDFIYIDDIVIEACGGAISLAKVEVPATSISVNLYPNPANHNIQLDCEISENTQAQMQIYDNVGQLVKNMTNIELNEGIQTLNVDVSDLPSGMYICALQSNEWQTVKKFVIAR